MKIKQLNHHALLCWKNVEQNTIKFGEINAKQKSLKHVACRIHLIILFYVLKTHNATRSMSNYFLTRREALTSYDLSPTCTRDWTDQFNYKTRTRIQNRLQFSPYLGELLRHNETFIRHLESTRVGRKWATKGKSQTWHGTYITKLPYRHVHSFKLRLINKWLLCYFLYVHWHTYVKKYDCCM